jgi:hypothetical protein
VPQVGAAVAAGVTALSAAAAASPLLMAALQLGAGLVLSAAARRLQGRPESPAARVSVRAPVVPRDIVYGRVRKGGTLIFLHRTRNDGKDYLHLIYALAGHQIEAIEKVYFDGREAIDVTTDTRASRYADSMIYRTRLGTPDQTAITAPFLPTDLWTPAHRCRGVPLLYLRLRGEADDYPSGLPNVTVLLRGRNEIFDPRTSTTGYTSNAALCLADYMASIRYGLRLGYGVEGGVETAALIAAANICGENVALAQGGTEPRYTVNGVLSTAATRKENIEALLTAMGGQAVYAGDRWRIYPAAYQTPTVALTPDDIRSISVTTRRSLADNFNAIRGQFVSPENDWQPDDFPPVRSAVYLAEDQIIESWRDLTLPFTTSSSAAQRLAKIELERTRRQQVVQVSGMLSAWRAQVGDTVTLTYPRWGYTAKPFEVKKVTLAISDGALLPELTFAEVSPLQYDWSASEQQIYAAAPPTDLPDPFVIGAPGAPQVQEALYETRDGAAARVRLDITWAASSGPFLDVYEVETRRTKTQEGADTGEAFLPLVRTALTVAERLDAAPGTWEVRVRAISTFGRRSAWSTTTVAVQGLAAPPAQLSGVTLQSAGGLAVLKWALPTDADVRIGGRVVIRHSALGVPTWPNSVSYDEVAGNQTIAVVPLKPGAYLLRAVDATGVPGPVTIVSTKGIQATPFVPASSLVEHPTFSGSKTNVVVNGSDQLTLVSVAAEGLYAFSATMDLGAVKAVRLRSVIKTLADSLASTIATRPGNISTWGSITGGEDARIDVIVEARFTDDNPGGSPTWTGWSRLDNNEVSFRGAQFRARLTSATPDFNLLIDELAVFADEVT